jgi:5-hydroxyisourate hydrolase
MISTHILDTSLGAPAAHVLVRLEKIQGTTWQKISEGKSNGDGRLSFECEKVAGTYRLTFEIEEYFKGSKKEFFFLQAPVIFKIDDITRKYHVPLLLSPFGYSTYRGS